MDAIRLTKELQKFEKASEFGIDSYKSLTKAVAEKYGKGSGLEVHHLIEQRLAKAWGMNVDEIPSVVLTKEEHQVFTNKWRKEIGYINSKAEIKTGNATREQIIEAAKEVYKDYPEFLKVLKIH